MYDEVDHGNDCEMDCPHCGDTWVKVLTENDTETHKTGEYECRDCGLIFNTSMKK